MSINDKSIWERFEAVAAKLEDVVDDISVCDNCEMTYPYSWVLDNVCPFCGAEHTNDE